MPKLCLLRHGQSQWNLENRFTGWVDVDLTDQGLDEARQAGRKMLEAGLKFDVAYCSFQRRAIKTLNLVLEEMDLLWLPVHKSWKLNERHYGALQGLNKAESADKWGVEQVYIWRRSYDIRPPLLDNPHTEFDPSYYAVMSQTDLPLGESLADTEKRSVAYFQETIGKDLRDEKDVLIVAHNNSLRSLIKFIEKLSDEQITKVELNTGEPLIYTLDSNLEILDKKTLNRHD
jgi:2,3-bisphosphoglycerate-dependent phosphoglycerate mutase